MNTNYPEPDLVTKYMNLKESASFNRIMFEHYGKLYHKYRWNCRWFKTFFAWKRMKQYEKKMYECMVKEMINDVNKKSYVPIILSC